jgi:ubiquinone/menaquinone biosynthesis C-methylase UbiE
MEHIEQIGESYGYLPNIFRKYMPDNDNPRILDLGAGYGECAAFLMNKGYDVFAADVDETLVSKTKSFFIENGFDPNHILCLRSGNGYAIPMPDKSFDIIYCLTVFEHISNLDETVKEMSRVLKDDGFVFTFFPSSSSLIEQHAGIPFVHWMPYSKFRENYLKIFLHLYPISNIYFATASEWNNALRDLVFYRSNRRMDQIISRYFRIHCMAYSDYQNFLIGESKFKRKNIYVKIYDRLHGIFHTRYLILKKTRE